MKKITISLCETHHNASGKPLYSKRFDKVQSFHFPPGYAPVEVNQTSFFINEQGKKMFDRVFKNTFGFYEGIATVSDEFGFFHINEQGQDIHSFRFEWSGNFQDNYCAVKDIKSKLYFHIDRNGNRAYQKQYTYAGDYKYGIAVVINENGLSTHIDTKGEPIHGKYFLELDVYHKGYAIAKDEHGYFHINKQGKEIYSNRYVKIEPYYNNRAVAIDYHNVKMIISPKGHILQTIDRLTVQEKKIKDYVSKKAFDYWHSRILAAILELDDKFHYNQNNNIPFIQADFFQEWNVEANIYILSRILHDWNDEQAIQILSNLTKNMDKSSILYVFETIIDEKQTIDKGVSISFHLLNLLGGRERTLSEFQSIFSMVGLKIQKCYLKNEIISLIKVMKET